MSPSLALGTLISVYRGMSVQRVVSSLRSATLCRMWSHARMICSSQVRFIVFFQCETQNRDRDGIHRPKTSSLMTIFVHSYSMSANLSVNHKKRSQELLADSIPNYKERRKEYKALTMSIHAKTSTLVVTKAIFLYYTWRCGEITVIV